MATATSRSAAVSTSRRRPAPASPAGSASVRSTAPLSKCRRRLPGPNAGPRAVRLRRRQQHGAGLARVGHDARGVRGRRAGARRPALEAAAPADRRRARQGRHPAIGRGPRCSACTSAGFSPAAGTSGTTTASGPSSSRACSSSLTTSDRLHRVDTAAAEAVSAAIASVTADRSGRSSRLFASGSGLTASSTTQRPGAPRELIGARSPGRRRAAQARGSSFQGTCGKLAAVRRRSGGMAGGGSRRRHAVAVDDGRCGSSREPRLGPWMGLAVGWCARSSRFSPSGRWQGQERVPRSGGVIIAANHLSWVDPFTLGHFVYKAGRIPRFMAKESLFRAPVIGRIVRGADQIPVHRGERDGAAALSDAVAGATRRRSRADLSRGHDHPRSRLVADAGQDRGGPAGADVGCADRPGRPVGAAGDPRAFAPGAGAFRGARSRCTRSSRCTPRRPKPASSRAGRRCGRSPTTS